MKTPPVDRTTVDLLEDNNVNRFRARLAQRQRAAARESAGPASGLPFPERATGRRFPASPAGPSLSRQPMPLLFLAGASLFAASVVLAVVGLVVIAREVFPR